MLLWKTSVSTNNINQPGDNGQPCLLSPNKETVTVREIVTTQQDSENEQIILFTVPQLCFIFGACLLLFSILHHQGLLTGSYRTVKYKQNIIYRKVIRCHWWNAGTATALEHVTRVCYLLLGQVN